MRHALLKQGVPFFLKLARDSDDNFRAENLIAFPHRLFSVRSVCKMLVASKTWKILK